jgi:GAF domain-containing protein
MNQFGSDATRILPSPGSVATTILKRLARSVVPSHADFCFIHVADGEELRCVATAHATRKGQRVVSELGRVYRIRRSDPDSTVAQVIRSGRPQLRSEIAVDAGPGMTPRVAHAHRQLRPRSAIVVPLLSGNSVLGALTLGYATSARRYGAQHLAGARRLARQIAACLANGHGPGPLAKPTSRAAPSTRRVPLRARV